MSAETTTPFDLADPTLQTIAGILAALVGGHIDSETAEDALLDYVDRASAEVGLLDTFASMVPVQLDPQTGLLPMKLAEAMMGGPMPKGLEAYDAQRLMWMAEAEGRWRYVKAAGMLKARNLGPVVRPAANDD